MDRTEAKRIKDLAQAILEQQNQKYDDWLYEKHFEIIAKNSDVLLKHLIANK